MFFSKNDFKKILTLVVKAMGKKLPNVRYVPNKTKTVKLDDGTEIIFWNDGILIIQNFNGIRNEKKVGSVVKKLFGDVTIKSGYINARDYGKKYKEVFKLVKPKNIKPLPKFTKSDFKGLTTKSVQTKILTPIVNAKLNRYVKRKQKNVEPKFKVLGKKNHVYKIVEYNDDIFVWDGFDLYYVKSVKEGYELISLMRLRSEVLRELMHKNWKNDTFGATG